MVDGAPDAVYRAVVQGPAVAGGLHYAGGVLVGATQLDLAAVPGKTVVSGQPNSIEALDVHPPLPEFLEDVQCL